MKDGAKKQIPLRISEGLYEDLYRFAESEFRSVNGQIEYLLTECVKQWKKNGGHLPQSLKNQAKEHQKDN